VKADSGAQDLIPDVKEVTQEPIKLQEAEEGTRGHEADEVTAQVPV
jgi:hypothetical protein